MKEFREIAPENMTGNIFEEIGKEWMLVSSAFSVGESFGEDYNTMTASWGGMGVLWNKPVAFVFVRPERHTFSFSEKNPYMTLSFFGDGYRKELTLCGRKSGRDTDKVKECGFTPVFRNIEDDRYVYFEEAKKAVVLKKLYSDNIEECNMIDGDLMKFYQGDGFHKIYICEIVKVLEQE